MLNWFKGRDLHSVLNEKKAIKVKGVNFVIKKIDALSFLDGSRVMANIYDTYKTEKPQAINNVDEKKVRNHLSEVIVSGCVSPKFSHKENEEGAIYVQEIFKDMDIANTLYTEILAHTYGKKKLVT